MFGRRPLLHWVLLLSLVAMWGSSFMLTKVAVSALSPSSVVAGRVVIATVILGIAMVFVGRRLPRWGRHWVFFIAMAVMGNCLPFWLISWGQRGIDSGLAGILMAVMPLATLVLAHVFVEGERLTAARAAGFATGFAGVVVLIGPEAVMEVAGAGSHLLSELAVLGGALCYAVATIIARRRPDSDALVAATGVAIAASVIMAPMAVATAAAGGPLDSPGPGGEPRRGGDPRRGLHGARHRGLFQADRPGGAQLPLADQLPHPALGGAGGNGRARRTTGLDRPRRLGAGIAGNRVERTQTVRRRVKTGKCPRVSFCGTKLYAYHYIW